MKDFAKLLDGHLTRRQVRTVIDKLVAYQLLIKEGEGASTTYKIAEKYIKNSALVARAFDLGIKRNEKTRGDMISKMSKNVQSSTLFCHLRKHFFI